jgi:curved DNA-binding protein CbpA
MNKSSKERETANEKMKKINEAFEILGDKDLRKRYDNGETITSNFDGYDYEEEIKAEKLRNEEELLRKELEEIDIQLEILKLEMKALDRSSTLNEIGAAFCFTFPRVNEEDLNPSL